MNRFWCFLRRGKPRTPPDARRAVERLSEDESLRGELTDAGYGPLLTTAANLAIARAARFESTDALYTALRRLISAMVGASQSGTTDMMLATATPPLLESGERDALAEAAASWPTATDERAVTLAQALARAAGIESS